MSALVEVLAKAICAERYDCAEAAGWATCDHGFGYRDAKPLAAAILAELQAVAADEGVRGDVVWTAVADVRDSYPRLPNDAPSTEVVDAALTAFLDHLDPARPSVPSVSVSHGANEVGE